jgi:hypothetical protein
MVLAFHKSFASGEITTDISARNDLTKFRNGLKQCRNWFIARHGGAYNRAGTFYRAEGKDQTKKIRIIAFQYGGRAFQLEFGHLYLRILKQGQPVAVASRNITHISKAASAVVTFDKFHGYQVGQTVIFSGVVGMTEINGLTGTVTAKAPMAITVNINSTGFTTYSSGGVGAPPTARNIEFTTPYTEDDIFEITYDKSDRVMSFAQQGGMPCELEFTHEQTWDFNEIEIGSSIPAPGSLVITAGTTGTNFYFGVTAIKKDTFEESVVATIGLDTPPTVGTVRSINWAPVAGATEYNIYCGFTPTSLGFLNVSYDNFFGMIGDPEPDMEDPPPVHREPIFEFPDSNMFPAAVGHFQQRRYFGNIGPELGDFFPAMAAANYDPKSNRLLGSRIASLSNFNLERPTQDDGPINAEILRIDKIRHFMDLGKLAIFAENGEWVLEGGENGALAPNLLNPRSFSEHGCGKMKPIKVDGGALFVEGNGSVVRTFGFDYQVDGYRGNEASIFSAHLFDGYELQDWAHQRRPHSIVWMVRDDGILLGMTYVPEQQVMAFHRHDFLNGLVESVCSVREGIEDVVYLVINRTIDGVQKRFIERMANRQIETITDAVFVDSASEYNGTNTDDGHTMTISGGTTWEAGEALTLTSSTGFFTADDATDGNAIHITSATGRLLRFQIQTYSSSTVVQGVADRDVPANLQGVARSTWGKAVRKITGLTHLEGRNVTVVGDGFLIANPNLSDFDLITVASGEIEFETPHVIIYVGEPIVADLETLNLDVIGDRITVDVTKQISGMTMWLQDARGLYVGASPPDDDSQDPIEGLETMLEEIKIRYEEGYDEPTALRSGIVSENVPGQFNDHGRVFARQLNPFPAGILAIAPAGYVSGGG